MGEAPNLGGKIWREHWIGCCRCEFHQPLGERLRANAVASARHMGWRLTKDGWLCPNHEDAPHDH